VPQFASLHSINPSPNLVPTWPPFRFWKTLDPALEREVGGSASRINNLATARDKSVLLSPSHSLAEDVLYTSSKGMNHTEEGQQILESRVYFKRQLTRRFLACASPCDVRIRRCSTSNQGSRHLGWAYWFCTSAGNPRRRPDHDNGVRRNHLRYVFIHCTALPLPKSPSYSVSTRQWRLKQNYDSNER